MNSVRIPTLSRYCSLCRDMKGTSILRPLQYEALRLTDTTGQLLDIGGFSNVDYRSLLSCDTYHSINIDPKVDSTWVIGVEEAFPVDSEFYDVVLSMNTFEHVLKPEFLIDEMTRALKPGGRFLAATPFLYRIHAHPYDYFRPTQTWWEDMLAEHGYDKIEVQPLVWGPYSTGVCARSIHGLGVSLRGQLALLQDILFSKLRNSNPEKLKRSLSMVPAGYFVSAKKLKPNKF